MLYRLLPGMGACAPPCLRAGECGIVKPGVLQQLCRVPGTLPGARSVPRLHPRAWPALHQSPASQQQPYCEAHSSSCACLFPACCGRSTAAPTLASGRGPALMATNTWPTSPGKSAGAGSWSAPNQAGPAGCHLCSGGLRLETARAEVAVPLLREAPHLPTVPAHLPRSYDYDCPISEAGDYCQPGIGGPCKYYVRGTQAAGRQVVALRSAQRV